MRREDRNIMNSQELYVKKLKKIVHTYSKSDLLRFQAGTKDRKGFVDYYKIYTDELERRERGI